MKNTAEHDVYRYPYISFRWRLHDVDHFGFTPSRCCSSLKTFYQSMEMDGEFVCGLGYAVGLIVGYGAGIPECFVQHDNVIGNFASPKFGLFFFALHHY